MIADRTLHQNLGSIDFNLHVAINFTANLILWHSVNKHVKPGHTFIQSTCIRQCREF